MGIVFAVIFVVVAGVAALMTINGFRKPTVPTLTAPGTGSSAPASEPLSTDQPTAPPAVFVPLAEDIRSFDNPSEQVVAAYRSAVTTAPGMHIVSDGGHEFFVDSRPSVRIMNGDYGSVLHVRVEPTDHDRSTVYVGYRPKTGGSRASRNELAAFREKERVLRMKAKSVGGLREGL